MIVFDGITAAIERERALAERVATHVAVQVAKGHAPAPIIAAILFREDTGSQLYTRLKSEAAARVGMTYLRHEFSLADPLAVVIETMGQLNKNPAITGIIVQKPWRKIWQQAQGEVLTQTYDHWWQTLMSAVDPAKDVDGLHPTTIAAIKSGTWREEELVLPATCQAVLFALESAQHSLALSNLGKVIIIGRTDLVGIPLHHVLQQRGVETELIGVKELEQRRVDGRLLTDAQVIVSATGQHHLITDELIGEGVVLVDVGEPRPDINRATVTNKASFLTPVPGGIGPLTVSFLLENAMILASKCS